MELRPLYLCHFPASSNSFSLDIACCASSIAIMLEEDNASIPVTRVRWNAIRDAATADFNKLRDRTYRDIVHCALPNHFPSQVYLAARNFFQGTEIALVDTSSLQPLLAERASTIVQCGHCNMHIYGKRAPGHTHVCSHITAAMPNTNPLSTMVWRRVPHTHEAARAVLRALNMAEDAPADDVEKLGKTLSCKCGHPNEARESMTFLELVCFAYWL